MFVYNKHIGSLIQACNRLNGAKKNLYARYQEIW